jgi:dihydroorotase
VPEPALVLRGCTFFGTSHRVDVAIAGGRIVSVGADLRAGGRIVECDGAYVSSAWIDSHIHVRSSATPWRVDPLAYGPHQGVCALIDAGSAPPARIGDLLDAAPWVFALANIDSRGIRGEGPAPEISGASAEEALACHPGRVRGIKVQASQSVLGDLSLEAIANAIQVAARHRVPVMVHVGNPPPLLAAVCDLLRPGDVITHYAHGKPKGATDSAGRPLPELRRAYERGVLLDVGHGSSSFSFRRCSQLLDAGIKPSMISTDLHAGSAQAPVVSLARTMSKLLALGLTEDEVIAAVTSAPARAFGLAGYGTSIAAGLPANLTLFRIEDRRVEVTDSEGQALTCERWFKPVGCVVGGDWFDAETPL